MTREERHERYRAGLCADCGAKPYSPGRPRCEDCHREYATGGMEPQLTREPAPAKREKRKRR